MQPFTREHGRPPLVGEAPRQTNTRITVERKGPYNWTVYQLQKDGSRVSLETGLRHRNMAEKRARGYRDEILS